MKLFTILLLFLVAGCKVSFDCSAYSKVNGVWTVTRATTIAPFPNERPDVRVDLVPGRWLFPETAAEVGIDAKCGR